MSSSKNADLIKQIKRYQNNILQINPPENDDNKVLHYIRKLAKLPIKLEELEETGVGKTINTLRKTGGKISEEATLLVAKWKAIVKKQVEEEKALEEQNTDDSDLSSDTSESDTPVVESKKHEISNRKRKRSEEKDSEIREEKYRKSDKRSKLQEEKHESRSTIKERLSDIEKKKKEKLKEDDRKRRKDEKHHKSSSRHDSKSHHISKSSQQEKKRSDEENEPKKNKKSKSKSKHESNKRESSDRNFSKELTYDKMKSKATVTPNFESANDFGAALLSIPDTAKVSKKPSTSSRSSNHQDSPRTPFYKSTPNGGEFRNGDIMKLEPLDIQESLKLSPDDYITSRYDNSPMKNAKTNIKTEEDMFKSMITTKNQRTKVFSGNKMSNSTKFPTLFELCSRVLQDNFDALEYTGGVPYESLKPILEKVSVQQLYTFENFNPYLIGETDELWEYHAKKEFRRAQRQEYESWRELYLRCVEEREEKLQSLTENITQSIANSTPVRKTKLAYVDSAVKPPRNVIKNQAKYGTGNSNSKTSLKGSPSSNSASMSVKERLLKESLAPNAIQAPAKSNTILKKKKAPLMMKTLQQMKTLKR